MSSKRKYSEFSAGHSVAGESRERTSSYQASKHKRRRDTAGDKPTSINWLKKRARTIERRLNRKDSLPANVQHELEKELDHHKRKLNDLADGKKRGAMIKKYHMVRFFERKKADRLAKQIRTQLEATTDEEERKKLQADLHTAEVDSLYARYFPHRERYVSLYPVSSSNAEGEEGAKTEDASTAARSLRTERPPLWSVIEKTAKKGHSALVQIQERKSTGDSRSKSPQERPSTHPQPKSKTFSAPESEGFTKGKGKHPQGLGPLDHSNDDDSDGGFFEEG
ncbi:hypothetical protein F5B22DRAFT_4367 [Xylaria bambusicola]|uniref:uncharacterized protein n=1 Tax=Xylaria bambusicola TaxID=326684 RepID=UPI00200737BA|nr:uncharacterized protein F5B22DRAFT_4367 [Xylaria bambusicola]KAI0527791.1 hypothetical protein F5B22DRAFT_4367 [Xylaria bambusicola]